MSRIGYRAYLPNVIEGSSYGYLPHEVYISGRKLKGRDIILIRNKYYRVEFISYNKVDKVDEIYLEYIENSSKL